MEYCKMWQVKLARAVWTRYGQDIGCLTATLRGTNLSGKRASGPQSYARMISSRLTLSALPVVRFACSLGTAAHRLQDAVWCQAQVVYCKPLEKPRFAVGLELFTRVERWAKPPRRQGAFQESIWSRLPQFCCFNPAFACNKRGVFLATPRETTDCYHCCGLCCTADISRDGNSYVPAKPQLDTWTTHHRDNGRWVSSLAYFHFRFGR